MSTRTKGRKPKKTRKPRKSKPKADDNDSTDDGLGTSVEPEDYTKFGGFLMAVLGALFGYSLVNSSWDIYNAIPKVIGIIFCLFVVFGGVLLLLPPEDRPGATQALVTAFSMTLKAIVTMGKEMAKQISIFRERRRQEKETTEKEEEASDSAP